jgi:hypothetical protein
MNDVVRLARSPRDSLMHDDNETHLDIERAFRDVFRRSPNAIDQVLKPYGVGVVTKATHHCMSSRGVHVHGTDLVTSRMLGCFRDNRMSRREFLSMVHSKAEQ